MSTGTTETAAGTAMPRLELPPDHPGFSDAQYRLRRDFIAAIGANYQSGQPIPAVPYTAQEDEVWRLVSAELARKHQRLACAEYLDGAARLALRRDRVPQLDEVSAVLQGLTGFRIEPVAGLVPARQFYGTLAGRRFLSSQYIRHHSVPFYTPEPDIIHEVIGHANGLANERLAALYEAAGAASQRATTADAHDFFSRVFWFTLEFGVVWEGEELRTYGAGILSSSGELDEFRKAEIHPLDLVAMGTRTYDITKYQPVLFAASSFAEIDDVVGGFFAGYDDVAYERLTGRPAA
jgi:phenylalanine-4-hydroxylase